MNLVMNCLVILATCTINYSNGFSPIPTLSINRKAAFNLHMSDEKEDTSTIPESAMDRAMREQQEKIDRSNELRSQEVFMRRSLGKAKCGQCDWIYDETKGDVEMIGGLIQPGTAFAELPADWRCPTCRASKDVFFEEVEEIPGFAVNQGYGLGGNALSANQKNGLIFGGLALFFVLFLSGYAMS